MAQPFNGTREQLAEVLKTIPYRAPEEVRCLKTLDEYVFGPQGVLADVDHYRPSMAVYEGYAQHLVYVRLQSGEVALVELGVYIPKWASPEYVTFSSHLLPAKSDAFIQGRKKFFEEACREMSWIEGKQISVWAHQ